MSDAVKELLEAWKNLAAAQARIAELESQLKSAREVIDKIAILGCGEHAYTSEFTNKVNGWARQWLDENK